jgi:hypothetical protein
VNSRFVLIEHAGASFPKDKFGREINPFLLTMELKLEAKLRTGDMPIMLFTEHERDLYQLIKLSWPQS